MQNDEWRTSIHEAGHAVLGRVMAQVCGGVSIDADDDSAGHSITADVYQTLDHWEALGRWRDFRPIVVGRIITFLAGREAEIEILGDCQDGDSDDRLQVAYMMERISFPRKCDDYDADRDAFLARLERMTRTLVRRHRGKIEAVSRALLESRTLSAGEVDGLLANQH